MAREAKYFPLTMESLRALGAWAADCAERALPVYEKSAVSDSRPRAAIEGIRVFADGGKRTAQLRTLALSALAAAREAGDPAAAAAARAAGLAASSAYTHPLVDVQQTKHIVGSAAYAALALELDHAGKSRLDTLLYMLDDGIRRARVERRNEGESHFDRENPGEPRNRVP